jgi:hypothetical protein
VYWWKPIRDKVVQVAGGPVGPVSDNSTVHDLDLTGRRAKRQVITYISRQEWGRRMLIPSDHHRLIYYLENLAKTFGYELNVVSADQLSRQAQIQLAARSTVMMGVHGNGLTALLWMNPENMRSTVFEFFYPEGWAFDYEWTARAIGVTHYGFWDDTYQTSPDLPEQYYPEGFQGKRDKFVRSGLTCYEGDSIPINGRLVAELARWRLEGDEEVDD